MTKKHKILLAVALVLAAAYAFYFWWTAPDPELAKDKAPPARGQFYSVQSLQDETQRIIDQHFPGCNTIAYDETGQKMVVTVWAYYFTADVLDGAVRELSILNKWRELEQNLAETGGVLQYQFDYYGHPEISTIIELVDPYDHDRVFATVSRGELVYDIVEATEPGRLISEP